MKICCFGSLNIDMVFSVDEFVRPKETIQSRALSIFTGGKGLNQAMAIRKSGVEVCMAGSVGPDGAILLKACDEHRLDRSMVRTLNVMSGIAVIQVDRRGENCIMLFDGANRKNDPAFMDEVLAELTEGDFLVLQNEINDLGYLLKRAHEKKLRIFLNPSPMDQELKKLPLELCSCLILNEVEGQALTDQIEPDRILSNLSAKFPETDLILTLGSSGVCFRMGETSGALPAYRVEAVDTTGAGDAFSGYLIGLLARGWDYLKAIDTAQRAAAISVTRAGASQSIPFLDEVLATELIPSLPAEDRWNRTASVTIS